MHPYDPGDYTPSDAELESIDIDFDREILNYYPDAQWNYGPEGAPSAAEETLERERRRRWRMIDATLLA